VVNGYKAANMKTRHGDIPHPASARQAEGFTLTELLVIVAVITLLVSLQVPAMAKAARRTKVAQCAENLRRLTGATHIFAHENNDRLPMAQAGSWAWDMPPSAIDPLIRYGATWQSMYCPGTAPRFTEADNLALFNFGGGSIRIIGYATTFPGSASVVTTNQNSRLTPQRIQVGPGIFTTPRASERVLLADATISGSGQNNPSQRNNYNYVNIQGGFVKAHLSPHLSGRIPQGGNVSMLDGHVEWRKFQDMYPRTSNVGPVFWW
jgi:prepilin-type processing-associated H-X9-DG protein